MTENSPWDRVKKYAKQVTEAPADPAQDNREYAAGDVTKTVARKAGLPNAEEVPHFNERESFSQEMSEAGDYIADASSNAWDQIKKTGTEFGDWIDRNPNFLVGALPTLVGALEGDFAAGAAIGGEGLIKRYDEGVKAETASRKRDLALEKAKNKTVLKEYYDPESGYHKQGLWNDYYKELTDEQGNIISTYRTKPGFEMKEQIKIDAAEEKAKRMGDATEGLNAGQLKRLEQVQDQLYKDLRPQEERLADFKSAIDDLASNDPVGKKAAALKLIKQLQGGRISDYDVRFMVTPYFGGTDAAISLFQQYAQGKTDALDRGLMRQVSKGMQRAQKEISREYYRSYNKLAPRGIDPSKARRFIGAPMHMRSAIVEVMENGKPVQRRIPINKLPEMDRVGTTRIIRYE